MNPSQALHGLPDARGPAGRMRTPGRRPAKRWYPALILAIAAALALDGWPDALVMALATDGTDGPTDAAGAVITGDTVARARALGLDPWAALEANDSYSFFDALGDLLRTGPTGTNVNDLLFVLTADGRD